MENMKTTSPRKHYGRTKAVDENSDLVSISKIKEEKKVLKKMNRDICEITERITKKMSKRDYLDSNSRLLNRLNYGQTQHRYRMVRKEEILRDLYMALDELNFMNNKEVNEGWFVEKLDKSSLNYLKHGSKNFAEEKQILRDVKIQHQDKDVTSFKSLAVLKETILNYGETIYYYRQNNYSNGWQKLVKEIEQFLIQHMERASEGNISNYIYKSLKKTIKDQIMRLCDMMDFGNRVKYVVKEIAAINGEVRSLRAKLIEKYNKKDEAYQRIMKLKKFVS